MLRLKTLMKRLFWSHKKEKSDLRKLLENGLIVMALNGSEGEDAETLERTFFSMWDTSISANGR